VSTGKITHVHSLEALFDWLKQKTSQVLESSAKKEKLLSRCKVISGQPAPCTCVEIKKATEVANTNGCSISASFAKE
jgi:hypothetical protein